MPLKYKTISTTTLLKRFEEAVRNHEMKGASHPDEQETIEQEFRDIKAVIHSGLKGTTITFLEAVKFNGKKKVGRTRRRGRA